MIAKTMRCIFAFAKGGSASPKTMCKQAAEGARLLASRTKASSILRSGGKPRFSCQRVEDNAFQLFFLLKVEDALRPVALGEFLSRFGLGLSGLDRC